VPDNSLLISHFICYQSAGGSTCRNDIAATFWDSQGFIIAQSTVK